MVRQRMKRDWRIFQSPPSLLSSPGCFVSWCSVTSSIHSNQHPFIHLFLWTNRKTWSWPSPPTCLPLAPIHTHSLLYSTFPFVHSTFHSHILSFDHSEWSQCSNEELKATERERWIERARECLQLIVAPLQLSRNVSTCIWTLRIWCMSGTSSCTHMQTHVHSKSEKTTQWITVKCSMKRKWREFTSAMYQWFSLMEDSQFSGEWSVYPAIIQKEGITMVFIFHFNQTGRHSSYTNTHHRRCRVVLLNGGIWATGDSHCCSRALPQKQRGRTEHVTATSAIFEGMCRLTLLYLDLLHLYVYLHLDVSSELWWIFCMHK